MEILDLCNSVIVDVFSHVGECSDRNFVHLPSAWGASGETKRGGREWERDAERRSDLWLECRAGGGRWLQPLLLPWPRKRGLCQRHRWVGLQVRLGPVHTVPPNWLLGWQVLETAVNCRRGLWLCVLQHPAVCPHLQRENGDKRRGAAQNPVGRFLPQCKGEEDHEGSSGNKTQALYFPPHTLSAVNCGVFESVQPEWIHPSLTDEMVNPNQKRHKS